MLAAKAVGLPVLHPSVTTSSRSPFFTYGHLVDIELGLQSSPPTPTSAEAPDREEEEEEEEVAMSSPLAEHTGDVASSSHTPVSVQPTELQSTPTATTIHAVTSPSPSPSLVQGAQTENDGHLEVYAQDAQPANTHTGPGELGPAANDGLGSGRGSQV